jgi:4-hydroxybenzoyl-CoA reductase subunit beta
VLRMQSFDLATPTTVDEAVALLAREGALAIAGGTDLLPNIKHELFEPRTVVALSGIEELRGIELESDGTLSIGATTTLAHIAAHEEVRCRATALAQAASLVAGPQLRTMGTLGGNVLLDTRCQWYNQSHFWRQSLGFCLKKDGSVCHVIESGSKCVAAASNDTAAPLLTLDAELEFASSTGRRRLPIAELYKSDGVANLRKEPGELLVRVRIPALEAGRERLGAYGKLRERGSIDFPLFGVAVRLDVADDRIVHAALGAVALQARPLALQKAAAALIDAPASGPGFDDAVLACAAAAARQLHPVANVPGDAQWRKEMAPIYVRETVRAARAGTGPVHGR